MLRALEDEPSGLSLGEIAQRVGLARSTVQRIVDALRTEQFVIAASPTAGVRLGPALVRLAASASVEFDQLTRPIIAELSQAVGETVDLSVLKGRSAVFTDQIQGSHRLRAVSAIGDTFPLHCTANGKAILSVLPDDKLKALLRMPLQKMTPNTHHQAGGAAQGNRALPAHGRRGGQRGTYRGHLARSARDSSTRWVARSRSRSRCRRPGSSGSGRISPAACSRRAPGSSRRWVNQETRHDGEDDGRRSHRRCPAAARRRYGLRHSRRPDLRSVRCAAAGRQARAGHSPAARAGHRLHGLRLCEVDRQDRRVLRRAGAGRAERRRRAVLRLWRQHAGAVRDRPGAERLHRLGQGTPARAARPAGHAALDHEMGGPHRPPGEAPAVVAEAFAQMSSGRPRPAAVEMPWDVFAMRAPVQPIDAAGAISRGRSPTPISSSVPRSCCRERATR